MAADDHVERIHQRENERIERWPARDEEQQAPDKHGMSHPPVDAVDLQGSGAELLEGRARLGPAEQSHGAAPSLPQSEKLQVITLQERGIEHRDGTEINRRDDLPHAVRVVDQPNIIRGMQVPLERPDNFVVPEKADDAV